MQNQKFVTSRTIFWLQLGTNFVLQVVTNLLQIGTNLLQVVTDCVLQVVTNLLQVVSENYIFCPKTAQANAVGVPPQYIYIYMQ